MIRMWRGREKQTLTSTLIAPPPDDAVVVAAAADEAVAEAESDADADEAAAVAEELALSALELLELSEEEVLDESAAELVEEAAELSVDDAAAADELELEPSLPDALFPAIETVHDLVSRTSGSPLSPVMGSRVIVHVWIMGPTELQRGGVKLSPHATTTHKRHSRLEDVGNLDGGRLRQVISIPGQSHIRGLLRAFRGVRWGRDGGAGEEQEEVEESDSGGRLRPEHLSDRDLGDDSSAQRVRREANDAEAGSLEARQHVQRRRGGREKERNGPQGKQRAATRRG